MKLASNLLAFGALLIVATVAAQIGRLRWYTSLINDRTFFEPFAWFNSPEAIAWSFELLFFFAFGMLVGRIFRSNTPYLWAFAFGAICGAFHFVLASDQIQPGVSPSVYVWLYGNYVMPALGALVGASTVQLMHNYSFKRTAAGRLQ